LVVWLGDLAIVNCGLDDVMDVGAGKIAIWCSDGGRACDGTTGATSVLGKDVHVAAVEKVTDELSKAGPATLVRRAAPVADEQDVDLWRVDDWTAIVYEVTECAGAAQPRRFGWLARSAGRDETSTYLRPLQGG
jgi:hypothetical protein